MKNIYKKIGTYFLEKRTFYLFMGICLSVLFLMLGLFYFKIDQFNKLEEKIEEVSFFSKATLKKRVKKIDFLKKHIEPDTKGFEEKIETLEFLANESTVLKALQKHPAYSQDTTLLRRDRFIQNNQLHFEDELFRKSTLIKETEKKQVHPVEMNLDDLNHLLFLLEQDASFMKKPQTFFKKFRLSCTPQETFLVDSEIIQREFYQKP